MSSKSDSKKINRLYKACDRLQQIFPKGEGVQQFQAMFEAELEASFSGIRFNRHNDRAATIPAEEAWNRLWDGSEQSTIAGPVFRTSTAESVMLIVCRDGRPPAETSLSAQLGYAAGSRGWILIPRRAKIGDYRQFLASLSKRAVLADGLTAKQREMISSLQKSRLAHRYDDSSALTPGSYGLTLSGKALYWFLQRRWVSYPLAFLFALSVLLSNVNGVLELACKAASFPWCP